MWNKFSLRIKITLLTAITLTLMCTCLTFISVLNTEVFYDPIVSVIDKKPIDEEIILNSPPNHMDKITDIDIAVELYVGSRNKFQVLSIITSVVVVLFGTLLSYILAGQALKSLKLLTNKIAEIDENNLSAQIVLPPSRDEISKLTESFNHMLKKLDKAFDSKKLFAANAAHELKTPLTNILTNIEVMQMEDEPNITDYEKVVAIAKENVERLKLLVQELLHFNSELDKENFEAIRVELLFDKILGDLSAEIREKNIKATIEGDIIIRGDTNLLERAFFNIIQNAVKYNKKNGEIIIVSKDGIITIEDTGIGIPEDSVPQIFDPFYCVDKSRSRGLGGNGLGLSITKQILNKHDMKVTVFSQSEKGTKIFIEL
jgi:Signal transduction histidine kinase